MVGNPTHTRRNPCFGIASWGRGGGFGVCGIATQHRYVPHSHKQASKQDVRSTLGMTAPGKYF